MLKYPDIDMYQHLTWAFVGHRLDDIEELEIDFKDHERYLNNVPKMTRLRKIWIFRGEDVNYEDMYEFAEAMIKAVQLHHGLDQVRECHMIPGPIEWGPDAYNSYPSSHEIDVSIVGAQRVFSLLPPPKHYFKLSRPDGSIVSLNHPFDPFVRTIGSISTSDELMWEVMTKVYPGHSHTQILQRFRGMRHLDIDPMTANGDDENILAWAACEAEHYYDRRGGRQIGTLVPLVRLKICYEDPYHVRTRTTRVATPKWKILQDGLLGFSSTMKCLLVTYPHSDDGMVDRLFTIPRLLPELKFLSLRGLAIDRSVWELAPNIENLEIDISFPPLRDNTTDPDNIQDDQSTETLTFSLPSADTTTTVTLETTTLAAEKQQWADIWFHFPKLEYLKLSDKAFSLFDPECFLLSPKLRGLSVIWSSKINHGVTSGQTYKVPRVVHSTRWTWNWSFQRLQEITLVGDLHGFRFSLAILRSCSALRRIALSHFDANHRFPLCAKGILDAPLVKSNNQMIPFTHSNLLSIKFLGYCDIEVNELVCLLKVLSDLVSIDFFQAQFSEGFGVRELVEITKTHPSLRHVGTDMEHETEPPSALGLSEITTHQQIQMSSIVSDGIFDEFNNKLSEERPWILYSFKNFIDCALYLQ
ncbi:hypothetical protein BGW42_008270 [Actinomortierella wolfii]|nr:hypothetical protein BGW42_008270 [Actinomortierella wolfii]